MPGSFAIAHDPIRSAPAEVSGLTTWVVNAAGWGWRRHPQREAGIGVAGMYQTTPEEMRRAAARVREVNEQVQTQLSQLRNQLAPLGGAWRGEAATAFAGLMQRWDADARALNQALSGIGDAIDASALGYQRAEQTHQQTMTAISTALG